MNSVKIIFLTFLSCFLVSCNSIKKSSGGDCDVISGNTLYKAINANSIYVLVLNDTAFFEGLDKGKPFYFSGFDTLVRTNDTVFENNKKKLIASNNGIIVLTSNKTFKLCKATAKEQSVWNYYKNNYLWVRSSPSVYNQIKQLENNSLKQQLTEEWENLEMFISKISHEEFKNKIEEFKKNY